MAVQATLPPQAADALRGTLPDLADEIVAAIAREVPDYARPMEGRFGETVRFGVAGRAEPLRRPARGRRAQGRPGRATPTRASARASTARAARWTRCWPPTASARRLAWRRFVDVGTRAGLPARRALRPRRGDLRLHRRDLRRVAPRASPRRSRRPRARASAAASGCCGCSCRTRRRRSRPSATAAQAAGWALPRLVAAVVAAEADQPEGLAAAHGEAGPGEEVADGIAARLARRLGPGAVGAAVGGLAVVMMPDPEGPGRRRALEAALGDELAALGPAVIWPEAGASLRRAEAAFRLAAQGRLDGTRRPRLPARPVLGLDDRPVPLAPGRRRRAPAGAAAGRRARRSPPTSRARASRRSTGSARARASGS